MLVGTIVPPDTIVPLVKRKSCKSCGGCGDFGGYDDCEGGDSYDRCVSRDSCHISDNSDKVTCMKYKTVVRVGTAVIVVVLLLCN